MDVVTDTSVVFAPTDSMDDLPVDIIENMKRQEKDLWASNFDGKRLQIFLMLLIPEFIAPLTGAMWIPALAGVTSLIDTNSPSLLKFELSVTVSIYIFTVAIFPLFWGTIADKFTRRRALIAAMLMFCISCEINAISESIYGITVSRILVAMSVSAFHIISVAITTDIVPSNKLATYIGIQSIPSLVAVIIGPPLSGVLTSAAWEWTMVFLAAFSLIGFILLALFLPETLNPAIAAKATLDPSKPLRVVLRNYKICIVAILQGITLGSLYIIAVAIPITIVHLSVANNNHDSDDEHIYSREYILFVSCALIPFGIGTGTGSVVGGKLSDYLSRKYFQMGQLLVALIFHIAAACGFIAWGWVLTLGEKQAGWIFPLELVLSFICATCTFACAPPTLAYSMSFYYDYSGTISSGVTAIVYVIASIIVTVGPALASLGTSAQIGYGVLMSVLAFLQFLALIPYCWVLYCAQQDNKYRPFAFLLPSTNSL